MNDSRTPAGTADEQDVDADIPDPHRWLEGDVKDDPRVRAWIVRQTRMTDHHLGTLPERETIRECLRSVWAFEKLSSPVRRGSRYFQEWNSGLLRQPLIQVQDGRDGPSRTVIDPNAMDPDDGDVVRDWQPSPDGTRVAFTVQRHGGDWRTLRTLDVDDDGVRLLPDVLTGLKAAQFAWHPDNRRLFYTAFEAVPADLDGAATLRCEVRSHRLGDPQSADALVFDGRESAAPLHMPRVSDDGRWLVVTSSNAGGSKSEIRVQDLCAPDANLEPLVVGLIDRWHFIGGRDDGLLFLTDADAPKGRIVRLDPSAGIDQRPVCVVDEGELAIRSACLAGNDVVVQALRGLGSTLRRYTRDGRPIAYIHLPALSVVDQLRGEAGVPELFFRVSSMIHAPAIHRCDLTDGTTAVDRAPKVDWRSEDYVVRQVMATSSDGTPIAVTLAHRVVQDVAESPRPTILMLYGGFGISPDLSFWESRFGWLALGGVFAIAHTRGGAEFGAAWADAGRKAGRHLVIADYLAAAAALCASRVTTPSRLIALGASNGGLMVAAATNARPEQFAVTLCRVPLIDLLRYTRFTLGPIWIDELGDPDDAEDRRTLSSYSPMHNIRSGVTYPAILVTTADADDRVVPSHSFKYVAALQAADIGDAPHLLRLEANAGHGEGKSAAQLIDEFTDLWSFAAAHTGHHVDGDRT